jgi:hypothetical protein
MFRYLLRRKLARTSDARREARYQRRVAIRYLRFALGG